MVVGGSNIHERLAHFFIDIYSDYMVENENYKSYTANNGTELRFPKESVVQMTAEQRDCYQNFINVLAQILIKYAAAEKENQKI